MKIVASIQARMGSSRLPGKVLADICGKPMLLWQVERIRRSQNVNKVVIATTISKEDDKIEEFCIKNSIECYRGSEHDVLDRIASLLKDLGVDLHIEFCGDSPLSDSKLIDEFIEYYLKNINEVDYISNAPKTSYPPGFEITIYPSKVLIEVDKLIDKDDPFREHVGYNITRFPDKFKLRIMKAPNSLTAPNTYLEVDTDRDLEFIRKVFEYFVKNKIQNFSLSQILDFLKNNPELSKSNQNIDRRWKTVYGKF